MAFQKNGNRKNRKKVRRGEIVLKDGSVKNNFFFFDKATFP